MVKPKLADCPEKDEKEQSDGKETEKEPRGGIQGQGGTRGDKRRSNACRTGGTIPNAMELNLFPRHLLDHITSEVGSGMNRQLTTYKSIQPVQTNPAT